MTHEDKACENVQSQSSADTQYDISKYHIPKKVAKFPMSLVFFNQFIDAFV